MILKDILRPDMYLTIDYPLPQSYSVYFIEEALQGMAAIESHDSFMVIIDQQLVRLYPTLYQYINQKYPIYPIVAKEKYKTPKTLFAILRFIQRQTADRLTHLCIIGGGLVQDIATLAAHLYYRGLAFTLFPTTLLAMADSCIGAKAAVNFKGYKNQLGAFCVPHAVYICSEFLRTLPSIAIYSGLAEIFKMFIIEGRKDEFNLAHLMTPKGIDVKRVMSYITASLAIKQKFIEIDPLDHKIRCILNYGHTFGHAIEQKTHYAVPHGLAILLGIDLINYLSMQLGLLSQLDFSIIHQQIMFFYSWSSLPLHFHPIQLFPLIQYDKKKHHQQINMVLFSSATGMVFQPIALDESLKGCLSDYASVFNDFKRCKKK